jgi:hypothetical protein
MAFPAELTGLPQWLCWRYGDSRNGKPTKVPFDPRTKRKASSTDPETWCDYEQAQAGAQNGFDGRGFVFTEPDDYCGIDIDKCRNPSTGRVAEWAQRIVDRFASYTEISPSGTGLHIIIKGRLPGSGIKRGGVEIYDRGRYFTMTGQQYGDHSEIRDCQTQLDELVDLLTALPGPEATRLMLGDWSEYASRSEADLALCNFAARKARGNRQEVDRLFRMSGLRRPKWDEKHGAKTYGELTLDKALKGKETASPWEGVKEALLTTDQMATMTFAKRKMLLMPFVWEQAIVLIAGLRGLGKTFFAMAILDAITRAIGFGPWEAGSSVPCLYLDAEMVPQDSQERIRLMGMDTPRESPLLIYNDAHMSQLGFPRANLADERWRAYMKGLLLDLGIRLWVVDNIGAVASGIDENSKQDWDPINQWLLELRFAGISTILIHHTNKEGGQRGTSAREDNLDVSILLRPPADHSPEDGTRFVVHFTKARIANKFLHMIGDVEMQLDEFYSWRHQNVKRKKKEAIAQMLRAGVAQNEIAREVGVTKSYVSKIASGRVAQESLF